MTVHDSMPPRREQQCRKSPHLRYPVTHALAIPAEPRASAAWFRLACRVPAHHGSPSGLVPHLLLTPGRQPLQAYLPHLRLLP